MLKTTRHLFFLLLLYGKVVAYGTSVNDTLYIKQLIEKSEKSDTELKVAYAQQAEWLADSILKTTPEKLTQNRKTILELKESACRLLAFYYRQQGNFPLELHYFEMCLQIREQLNNKRNIASAYNNIGISYYKMGYVSRSLDYFAKSIKLLEQIGDTSYVSTMLNNLGVIFKNQGEHPEALSYFNRALKLAERINDKAAISYSLNNIGGIYVLQNKDEKANACFLQALASSTEAGEKGLQATSLNWLGHICKSKNDLKGALTYYMQGFALAEQTGDRPGIAKSYNLLADLHLQQKNYPLAMEYAQKSLAISLEQKHIENIRNAEETLAGIDSAQGNYAGAYRHYRQFILYRDSIQNTETRKASIKNQLKYEFDKKEEAAQEELNRQKILRNGFIAGFTVMLLFAGVFFYQRNKIGKEKHRSESLLLNILPKEVAEELKDKGNAEARYFDNVTVFFSDFKSFTTISEKLTPEQLVNELHECFSAFDKIMEKYNIEKIKTVGDAYLAVSGLPLANPNHAEDVVKAALEIQRFMADRKKQKENHEGLYDIRVGVNSGSVVAGIVGVKKFAYDIWGDTVNTAARMEQNGEPGKVNISEATYELVKDNFKCEYRGEIEAKNKGKLKMYFVS